MLRSLAPLFLAGTFTLFALGCAGQAAEPSASSTNQLAADRKTLPTAHTTLLAGDPYIPVLDERPTAIGDETCLADPVVSVTPGATTLDAAFVASQSELLKVLDLSIDGVKIPKLSAATGAARIAAETRFYAGSIHVVFQAMGTFESELVSLSKEPEPFRADRVARCGWGWVKKAYHRLAAVVVVSIEAANETSVVALGCRDGNANCPLTGVSAGPVTVKAALEDVLKRGTFNVSLRAAADVIPGLPPAPLGALAALSSTPETYEDVLEQLGAALDWLGKAQISIAEAIAKTSNMPGSAPTTKVDFTFYPGLPADEREELGTAFDVLLAARAAAATNATRMAAWKAFGEDASANRGHLYNVPGSPAQTVDELLARRDRVLGPGGLLDEQERTIDRALIACEEALRNSKGAPITARTALVRHVVDSCKAPPAAEWEARYDADYGIRRLAPSHVSVDHYDEWRDKMCPPGQRLAKKSEASLLAPWSFVAPRAGGGGIWIRRDHFWENPYWIKNGQVEELGMFQGPRGLTICFRDGEELFE